MSFRSAALLLCSGLLTSGVASACPSTYAGYTCAGSGATSVCQVLNETNWVCDLTANGDSAAGTITVVSGYATYDYAAWGTDATGASFCCTTTGVTLARVAVFGGSYDDTVALTTTITGVEYDLENVGAAANLTGFVDGRQGADTLYGSNADGDDYQDALHGGDDDDTLRGYAGGDELTGDAGDDVVYGGNGADRVHGDAGADTIYGEGGADTILGDADDDVIVGGGDADLLLGNAGADRISGSAGNDILDGDAGADVLCGGSDDDSLSGGGDKDQLWGDSGTDLATGGTGVDSCSADTATCDTTLSRKPSRCP